MRLLLTVGLLISLATPAFAQNSVQQQSQRWHCQDHPGSAYQIEDQGFVQEGNEHWKRASDDYSQAVIVRDFCSQVTSGQARSWHLIVEALDLSALALAVKHEHNAPYQPFLRRGLFELEMATAKGDPLTPGQQELWTSVHTRILLQLQGKF